MGPSKLLPESGSVEALSLSQPALRATVRPRTATRRLESIAFLLECARSYHKALAAVSPRRASRSVRKGVRAPPGGRVHQGRAPRAVRALRAPQGRLLAMRVSQLRLPLPVDP